MNGRKPKFEFILKCGLAGIFGLVYAMAYPPVGWGGLVFPSLIGLLWVLRGEHGTRARTLGFLHGMVAYGASLSWLANIFGSMSIVLWAVLAVFTALFAEMQSRASDRGVVGWKFAVFTAVNWGAWEFIRAELFPLKMPWMTAGLAVGPNVFLPWIGVYGVSVLVVVCAAVIAARMWKAGCLLIGVIVVGIIGLRPYPTPPADDPLRVNVAGIQLEGVSLDDYLAGSRKTPEETDYVVWPEYAVPFDITLYQRDWNAVLELCRERDITLTLGTQSRPTGGDTWKNIALTLDSSGRLGQHVKVHPVHFFDDGVAGDVELPVQTKLGKVGTPICFDCDYEGVVRKMTLAGAEWFVVPTMDAASWSARQHDQHAQLARIRACENGRWMFVCATSGVSQVIDPNGNVHSRLGALKEGIIHGSIRRESEITFYTKLGWLVPWGAIAAAVSCWTLLAIPKKWITKSLSNK